MNSVHVEDELLQHFFDGELSGEQASKVQHHLEECPQCHQRHRSLVRLREFISMAVEDMPADADFDRLFNNVTTAIDEGQESSKVIHISDWLQQHVTRRPQVWMPATMVAVAAAVFIAFFTPSQTSPNQKQDLLGKLAMEKEKTKEQGIETRERANSEIVQVDFGKNTGTVFEIALAEGVSTPVVWINDEIEEIDVQ